MRGEKIVEHRIARSTKLPEETKGMLQLVGAKKDRVLANVVGEQEVGIFDVRAKSRAGSELLQMLLKLKSDEKYGPLIAVLGMEKFIVQVMKEERLEVDATGYIISNEDDVKKWVKNTKLLEVLLKDPIIKKRADELLTEKKEK